MSAVKLNIKLKQYMIIVENKNKGFILKFMDAEEEVKEYSGILFIFSVFSNTAM